MLQVVLYVIGVGPLGGFGLCSSDKTINRIDFWLLRRFGALGGGRFRQGCAYRGAWHFAVHTDFDNGAVSLPIGGDKKAVRHECGTADGGVKVGAGDFGVKGSASERDHWGLLGLGWRVVGGVMPACVRKAEQGGSSICAFSYMPAKSLNRVA